MISKTAANRHRFNGSRRLSTEAGFTLVELVVVIMIIAVMSVLLALRTGTFSFWRDEGFIRKLSETIIFLHHQAVVDQRFYVLKFDMETNDYRVGEIQKGAETMDAGTATVLQDSGTLSIEIAEFLSPALAKNWELTPPEFFPSMAEPNPLPPNCSVTDVNTMRGPKIAGQDRFAFILFSPRGFSEFAVIHLKLSRGEPVTILVNPFTGLTDIYRSYKEFEWTYGNKNKKS